MLVPAYQTTRGHTWNLLVTVQPKMFQAKDMEINEILLQDNVNTFRFLWAETVLLNSVETSATLKHLKCITSTKTSYIITTSSSLSKYPPVIMYLHDKSMGQNL
jgi:hypothetical protein